MHIARALANAYLWNKGNHKYYPDRRFKLYVPKDWALEIISEEEWNKLEELAAYTDENGKYAAEFYSNPDNKPMPDTYITIVDGYVAPHYTNNYTPHYEDIVDCEEHMQNGNAEAVKGSYLFPYLLGIKVSKTLQENGFYDKDSKLDAERLNNLSEEELNAIVNKSMKNDLFDETVTYNATE
jgi:hypothetical protein